MQHGGNGAMLPGRLTDGIFRKAVTLTDHSLDVVWQHGCKRKCDCLSNMGKTNN